MMLDSKKTCCFTGHRIISKENTATVTENLPIYIKKLFISGITNFITGGALGFDTLAANAVLSEKEKNDTIRLILALPCKEQTKNWHNSDILEYERILSLSDEIIYVSDEYFDGCMQKRNRFMVDNSEHCIFYMSSPRGGTAYTVKYALEKNKNLYNIMITE